LTTDARDRDAAGTTSEERLEETSARTEAPLRSGSAETVIVSTRSGGRFTSRGIRFD
jgi:hypothetical protein